MIFLFSSFILNVLHRYQYKVIFCSVLLYLVHVVKKCFICFISLFLIAILNKPFVINPYLVCSLIFCSSLNTSRSIFLFSINVRFNLLGIIYVYNCVHLEGFNRVFCAFKDNLDKIKFMKL